MSCEAHHLWFERGGLEAAQLYTALIPNSTLDTDASATSIVITTHDQDETDKLWDALTANGGEPGRCGWLRDRWGVSWQIVPEALSRLLGAPDREAASRAQAAMMQMGKIDIAALEAACHATEAR